MLRRKVVIYPLIILSTVATLATGCATKKPIPTTPPRTNLTPAPVTPPKTTTMLPPNPIVPAPTPADAKRLSQSMATKIGKIKDVRNANVVISGNTATVGLDLAGKLSRTRINAISKEASTIVKKEDSRITTVYVANDTPTVNKIKNIAGGLVKGKTITSFSTDLAAIQKGIIPMR